MSKIKSDLIKTDIGSNRWTITLIITIIITLLIIFIYNSNTLFDDVTEYKSSVDSKIYDVRSNGSVDNKEKAANYLAEIYNRVNYLVHYIKENKLKNEVIADRLYSRWSLCKLRETSSTDNSVAFTINKGQEIRLCIRNGSGSSGSDKGQDFEDINTSIFVILHELAHVMSISYGHNEEFKDNFSFLLHLASSLGLYKPQNFEQEPKTYCGTVINSTPCSQGTC
jgi:hypothetical protein